MFKANHLELDYWLGSGSWIRWFSLSMAINCCSSSCRCGATWISPFMLTCPLVLALCWSCLGYHIAEISWVQLFCHIQRIPSFNRYPSPLTFIIFLRLWCFLSLNCRNRTINLQIRPRHPIVSCSLHVHQLWIFVMVSVWCKMQLLQEEMRASLICGAKDMHLEYT